MRLPSSLLAALALAGWAASALAHPIPDIPVQAEFAAGGAGTIRVEIDLRCFDDEPATAPYFLHEYLPGKPEAWRTEHLEKARAYVARNLEFFFEPLGRIVPDFQWDFTGKGNTPLTKADDPVVLTATWHTTVPAGLQGYRIRSTPQNRLSVLFLNRLRGEPLERTQVLFPGETSFLLDLHDLTAGAPASALPGALGVKSGAAGWWHTLADFFREGFLHVMPLGLDHILFVLGLFLLQRAWRPLLWQVTAFTLAHTFTLGLATLGAVQVQPRIVEPLIAASIAFVAVENIFRPRYTVWRLAVVFGFGLVHGLGFASALRELHLPTSSLVVGLLGFNVGVEGGQLAVIALAFLATAWLRDPLRYRAWIVIPGSTLIALTGVWWTVTRALGI